MSGKQSNLLGAFDSALDNDPAISGSATAGVPLSPRERGSGGGTTSEERPAGGLEPESMFGMLPGWVKEEKGTVDETVAPGVGKDGVSGRKVEFKNESFDLGALAGMEGSVTPVSSGGLAMGPSFQGSAEVGIILVDSSADYCGGQVGGTGSKWCTEERCAVKAHRKKDPKVRAGFVYIRAPGVGDRAGAAFSGAGRCIAAAVLGMDDLGARLRETNTPQDWEVSFKEAEQASKLEEVDRKSHALGPADRRQLEEEYEKTMVRSVLPTPLKPRTRDWETGGRYNTEMRKARKQAAMLQFDVPTLKPLDVEFIFEDSDEAFKVDRERINLGVERTTKLRDLCVDELAKLDAKISVLTSMLGQVDSKVVKLDVALGKIPEGFPGDIMSAWDAIEVVYKGAGDHSAASQDGSRDEGPGNAPAEWRSKVEKALATLSKVIVLVQSNTNSSGEIRVKLDEIMARLVSAKEFAEQVTSVLKNNFAPKVKKLMIGHDLVFPGGKENLIERVEKLEARPTWGGKSVGTQPSTKTAYDFGFGVEAPAPAAPAASSEGTNELRQRVGGLEQENRELKQRMDALVQLVADLKVASDPQDAKFSGADGFSQSEAAAQFAASVAARMEELERSVSSLNREFMGGTIVMGDYTFEGLESCVEFVKQHVPNGDFSMMFDAVSISHATRGDFVTVKESAEETTLSQKAGFKSAAEANIAASMQTVLPHPYGTKGRSSAKIPLPGLGSSADFLYLRPNGTHKEFLEQLTNLVFELRGTLRTEMEGYTATGVRVMRALVEKAFTDAKWMLDNVGHLKNFFDDNSGEGTLSKSVLEKNWEMATRVNELYYRAMKTLRSVAARSGLPPKMQADARALYCGRLLWATLRTHNFMEGITGRTVYQSSEYQETVMLHVVENFMSLSRFDNLKSKTQDYDNRLNRLEQHCKLSGKGKGKE